MAGGEGILEFFNTVHPPVCKSDTNEAFNLITTLPAVRTLQMSLTSSHRDSVIVLDLDNGTW
jgi:hypothetical protein